MQGKEVYVMTVEELRAIARQYPKSFLTDFVEEDWITTPLVEVAMAAIDPLYRDRLNKFVGVSREDWGNLVLPKKMGGDMIPCYPNACHALRSGLRHLHQALLRLKRQGIAADKMSLEERELKPSELIDEIEKRCFQERAVVILTIGQWERITEAYHSPLVERIANSVISVYPLRAVGTTELSFRVYSRRFRPG